jgi:hypothetical protein
MEQPSLFLNASTSIAGRAALYADNSNHVAAEQGVLQGGQTATAPTGSPLGDLPPNNEAPWTMDQGEWFEVSASRRPMVGSITSTESVLEKEKLLLRDSSVFA